MRKGSLKANTENYRQHEKTFNGDCGQPQDNITREQLQYFIEYGLKAREMSALLGVSHATVQRRLQYLELSTSLCYTALSDKQLDIVVRDIKQCFLLSGYKMVLRVLRLTG